MSPLQTTGFLKVNTGSNVTSGESTSSNDDATTAAFCRGVTGTCRSEKMPDRDDITVSTFSHTDATAAGTTGSRPNDNSGDSLATPTSCPEDSGEVRVRFRFDSVSCTDLDQKDVSSTLPKEPHPVRDQTVHRRSSPRDDIARQDPARSDSLNNICLSPPSTPAAPPLQRTLSESTEEDGNEVASLRPRWLFRRRARGRQRQKPSSALRKEIKAARQLGVIMGAFTVCFLPYFVSARGPPRASRHCPEHLTFSR